MADLRLAALRRILEIDAELEPLEDSFEPLDSVSQSHYTQLKNQLIQAEQEYYKLNQSQASPWSLVTRIVEQAKSEADKFLPPPEPEVTDRDAQALISELWLRAYL